MESRPVGPASPGCPVLLIEGEGDAPLSVTTEFEVRSLDVLEVVGSDHLPIRSELCLTGRTTAKEAPDPVSTEDREDVEEVMGEYQEDKAD